MCPNDTIKGRNSIRYLPDPGTLARVQFGTFTDKAPFTPELYALVFEESAKGCGILCVKDPRIEVGAFVRVQPGELKPIAAEIRWVKELDTHAIKFGLMYLE